MAIDTAELLALPAIEKLRLVELLWDDLGESAEPFPLPEWMEAEALRRRDELRSGAVTGVDHATMWKRIGERNG